MSIFSKKTFPVTSFEIITLTESGMRGSWEKEILYKDGCAELSVYFIRYTDGKDERVLEKRVSVPVDAVLKLLNECGIPSWDGFHGKHPYGVLDGIMFRFTAKVNDGLEIHADGSQNFPKQYRDFTDGLYEFLKDAK